MQNKRKSWRRKLGKNDHNQGYLENLRLETGSSKVKVVIRIIIRSHT